MTQHQNHEELGALPLVDSKETISQDTASLGSLALIGENTVDSAQNWQQYLDVVLRDTHGPQLEGFLPNEGDEIMADQQTRTVMIREGESIINWPLITPIKHFSEYLPGYFDRNYGSHDHVYYVALPPVSAEVNDAEIGTAIADTLSAGKLLVYDELNGQDKEGRIKSYVRRASSDVQLELDQFIDPKNQTPASVAHFQVPLIPLETSTEANVVTMRDAYAQLIEGGEIDDTKLLPSAPSTEAIEELWEIYEAQFSTLTENQPSRQLQYKHEFFAMIANPDAHTIVHYEEDQPVAFSTFVTDIASCDWLNKDYYTALFPGEDIFYFPGIASDPNKRGRIYSSEIIGLMGKLVRLRGKGARLVFQSTNISAAYVPRIVERGIRDDAHVESTKVTEIARYNYRGIFAK